MGKTLADVDLQVRQLIGDYQRTQFTEAQVMQAVNWAQDAIMRIKGFKVASRLYTPGSYPTGDMPTSLLAVKRIQLVTNSDSPASGTYTITVTPSATTLAANVVSTLSVSITRYGGFTGPVSLFIPMNAHNGSNNAGIYISSPTSKSGVLKGNYIGEVSIGTTGDAGFIYTDAPNSFSVDMIETSAGVLVYSGVKVVGLSSLEPVFSNPFSVAG
jgi:hypothetical protein